MNDAYEMINDCMRRLREADIPRMQQLQVEIVLLRIKRYMLALEGQLTNRDYHRQLGIENFYADFTRQCCSSDVEVATGCQAVVEEMADRLAAIVEAVGKDPFPSH